MSPSSVVAWRGPSQFDGTPVQVVLVGLEHASTNEKTGPMVQAYILPAGVHPVIARREGADRSVCGDCRGRPCNEGWCYVAPLGLLSLGRAVLRGKVPARAPEAAQLVAGRSVRCGAYGDPAAVPYAFWKLLLADAASWTGYTHAWRTCDVRFQDLFMASVDDHRQATDALSRGWRYFRVKVRGAMRLPSEVDCPAQERDVKCVDCLLCRGLRVKARNVVIDAHGFAASSFRQPTML